MPRLVSKLLMPLTLFTLVACAQTPATPTVTLAKFPAAAPTPVQTVSQPTQAPTALPPTDVPSVLASALPAPKFRLLPDVGITAEYRADAADIGYAASASGFAWARVEYAADGTRRYPGFVFVPGYNLQEMRPVTANHPVVLAVESMQERVVTGSADGAIEIWNAQTGVRDQRLGQVTGRPTSIALNGDDSLIAVGANGRYAGGDGSVMLWNQAHPNAPTIVPSYGKVTRVRFAPDNKTVYFSSAASSCARGGAGVFQWDGKAAEATLVLSTKASWVRDFALHPLGHVMATVSKIPGSPCTGASNVLISNVGDEKILHTLSPAEPGGENGPSAVSVAFSPDGARVAIGDSVGNLYLWDWEHVRILGMYEISSSPVAGIVWASNNVLLLDDEDGYVRLFRAP